MASPPAVRGGGRANGQGCLFYATATARPPRGRPAVDKGRPFPVEGGPNTSASSCPGPGHPAPEDTARLARTVPRATRPPPAGGSLLRRTGALVFEENGPYPTASRKGFRA